MLRSRFPHRVSWDWLLWRFVVRGGTELACDCLEPDTDESLRDRRANGSRRRGVRRMARIPKNAAVSATNPSVGLCTGGEIIKVVGLILSAVLCIWVPGLIKHIDRLARQVVGAALADLLSHLASKLPSARHVHAKDVQPFSPKPALQQLQKTKAAHGRVLSVGVWTASRCRGTVMRSKNPPPAAHTLNEGASATNSLGACHLRKLVHRRAQ